MSAPSTSSSASTSSPSSGSGVNAIALASLMTLFFVMGFITVLNDILIPYLKIVFQLNYTQVMLINTCFFGAYFVMSIPSGRIVERIGYKRAMLVGFAVAALGCLLFYPAAGTRSYPFFLAALFILASGITMLQVAGNPYVAVLGKPETASARLTLTQAFNSLATFVAPFIGTKLVLQSLPAIPDDIRGVSDYSNLSPTLAQEFNALVTTIDLSSLQSLYIGLAVVLLVITGVVSLLKLPAITASSTGSDTRRAWSFPHLRFGTLGIFAYVGAEVAIGSFLVSYLGQQNVLNLPEHEAGNWVPYYWGGAMVGRFIGSVVLSRVYPPMVLTFNAIGAAFLVLLAILLGGELSAYALIAVGLMNSLMFSTIFTLAVKDLGTATDEASGILCTAIVGGAVVPLLMGALVDKAGFGWGFVLPLLCYAYIAWYGLRGHRHGAA